MSKAISILWLVVGCGGHLFSQDFEAPHFKEGDSITGQAGWQISGTSGTAVITAEQAATGQQSVQIEGGAVIHSDLPQAGVVFVDLEILPLFEQAAPVLNIGGAKMGFALQPGGLGTVVVFSGTENSSVPISGANYAVEANSGYAEAWIRVTVRLDTDSGKWDLFLDGKLVAANLPLSDGAGSTSIQGPLQGSLFLDNYGDGADNPLFADTDHDGMPDAYEVANGLSPYFNDRDADLDGDGVSNIQEMVAGSSPRVASSGPNLSGNILYVDNATGNNAYSGKVSYQVDGDGPLASLKAAMIKAQSGDTIVVLPGKGVYFEGSRGVRGKELTIRTLSNVVIK